MKILPPPVVESLAFSATRRMLSWLLIVEACFIVALGGNLYLERTRAAPGGSAVQLVPPLDFTTDAGRAASQVQRAVFGSLPGPGPNQKRAGECLADAAQVEINGGCWVETKMKPPCPVKYQWEHEGKCWLPVAHAAPVPTSGGSYPANIAGE